MKYIKKLISLIVIIAMLFTVFTFLYFRKSSYRELFGAVSAISLAECGEWEDITEYLDAPYEAINSEGIHVYVTEGGGIYATDDEENIIWSNVYLDEDNAFTNDENFLLSPFFLEYNFAREQKTRFYTLQEAVERQQFKAYIYDNKIITEYILGECGSTFLLPKAIPVERFENEIIPSLDDDDASYLTRRFTLYDMNSLPEDSKNTIISDSPGIKNVPLYILSDAEGIKKKEKTAEILKKVGYTTDKYEIDRKITLEELTEHTEAFHVTVVYSLEGKDLIVNIPCDQIEFFSDNPLLSIGFSPYGCYGESEDEGYYILPVNSGVIESVGGDYEAAYMINMIGPDLVQSVGMDLHKDIAPFPIYGMVKNKKGCFAIVEEGAEITSLNLEKAKGASTLYPSFRLLEQANVSIVTNKQSSVYGQEAYKGNITVRYHFMDGDSANYSAMANYYREYLLKRNILSKNPQKASFLLELVGNITANTTIASLIPIKTSIPLTTFNQCQDILNQLRVSGEKDYAIKLSGFNKHGLFGQLPGKYEFDDKLGAKDIRETFFNQMKLDGTDVYLDVNMGFYYDNHRFSGFNEQKSSARFPNNNIAKLKVRNVPSGLPSDKAFPICIISSSRYKDIMKGYTKGLDKNLNISIGDTALYLNTDFNTSIYADRSKAAARLKESLDLAKDKKILSKSPATYLLSNLSMVEDLLYENSRIYNFDNEIPFVQMVLHGAFSYASYPINSFSEHKKALLNIIETGSTPKYKLAYQVDNRIMKTEYNYLYNISYSEWKDIMISDLTYLKKALDGLEKAHIISHKISDKLRRIEYDNGTIIYVNYGAEDVVADGIIVPQMNYIRK